MKLKALVVTLPGTTAQRISSDNLYVPLGFWISVDSSGVVYIGDSDVDSTHGAKLPNTPMNFGDIATMGSGERINLKDVWVKGGSGSEVIRILYASESRQE